MKKYYILLPLLSIMLSACSQNETAVKTLSTPQTVENFSKTPIPTPSSDDSAVSTTTSSTDETVDDVERVKTFKTQQEFVDYMHTKVKALEDTIALVDSNLSQIFSVLGTDEEAAYLGIRETLFQQMSNEAKEIETLTLPTNELKELQQYVTLAYNYTVEAKKAEYNIYKAETLEKRQELLDANEEPDRLSHHYLQLAWDEISRLSNETIYRK